MAFSTFLEEPPRLPTDPLLLLPKLLDCCCLAAARLAPPPPPPTAALPERKTAAARALLPDIGRFLPWSGAPGGDPKAQHSIRPCGDCSQTPIWLVAAEKGLSPSTTIVAVERPDGAGNVSRAASCECVRLPDGGKFPDKHACVFRTVGNFCIAGVCASNGRSSWAL